jgi:hypothetical protein
LTTKRITLETEIEDLVRNFPESVGFLTRNGVRCIRCGEPVWCSLGELLKEDGIAHPQGLVDRLNDHLDQKDLD